MASKKTTKKAAKPKAKKKKAPAALPAPRDHNISEVREELEKGVNRVIKLHDDMGSEIGRYRSDIGHALEKVSDATGIKKSVIAREVRRIIRVRNERESEAEMALAEREQTILFRHALEKTQLELFSAGELAPSVVEVEPANDEGEEKAAAE